MGFVMVVAVLLSYLIVLEGMPPTERLSFKERKQSEGRVAKRRAVFSAGR
jgi:hypothetical protein